jgi:phospholipid/cholesterol/gamma-HCH transport system ATP-binding protein
MTEPVITVRNLTLAYGPLLIQRDLNFSVRRGDIFVIMGGSGCGKSTLLMHLIGLQPPASGSVWYGRQDFWQSQGGGLGETLMRRIGVLFQSGALLSS